MNGNVALDTSAAIAVLNEENRPKKRVALLAGSILQIEPEILNAISSHK